MLEVFMIGLEHPCIMAKEAKLYQVQQELVGGPPIMSHRQMAELFFRQSRVTNELEQLERPEVIEHSACAPLALLSTDVMAIPADAPHPKQAHQLIDFLLRPEVIAKISNFVGYANAVPASQPLLDEEVRQNKGIFPPAEVDTLPVVIKSQSLEWPRNAARSKGKGVVVVQLTVNASGGVDEVEVLRADHTGWGIPEAAVEAASGYRYKPGTKNGVAITTHAFVTWRYDFTLE